MTCKDCLHFDVCEAVRGRSNRVGKNSLRVAEKHCPYNSFADKSEWVHLPCKVGEQVFVVYADEIQHTSVYSMKIESEDDHFIFIVKCMISWGGARFEKFIFGQTAFLTREEAEKALDKQRETLNGGKIND